MAGWPAGILFKRKGVFAPGIFRCFKRESSREAGGDKARLG